MFQIKWKKAPILPESVTQEVERPEELWAVRWMSRRGAYSSDVISQAEFFLTKADAEVFHDALKAAHQLLRNTNKINLHIEKVR